ncbi:MAG: hypothetical protein GXY03_04025 [Solirubrobacterales bacterium]|nr:hypothetical protein [Solirubrobacterales bacterium]
MFANGRRHIGRAGLLAGGAALLLAFAGCGEDDFANEPRPPTAVDLSAVIRSDAVTISPASEGAGRVQITISNQTDRAHTVTLEGEDVIERTAQIQPQDTAQILKTLEPGTYEIRAGSPRAVDIGDQIRPATLRIGPERESSSREVLLP